MAVVFLLGPSEWDPERGGGGEPSPMGHRRELAKLLAAPGHEVLLMEDEPDAPEEDMVEKFERLAGRSSDVAIDWPPKAKMATTYDEMLLLRKMAERATLPRLWFLHHESVASISRGVFRIHEGGGRSRYLTALARLGITPIPWRTVGDLYERAAFLAGEMT